MKSKIAPPANPNYAVTVVAIQTLNPLDGCDNVSGSVFFGYQAIISKDHAPGELGVFFPAEVQLSEEFVRVNNLFRKPEQNADPTQKGYIEDNRRVKAMKFRGHRSDGFWLPLSALNYTGVTDLEVGDTFDTLNGHEICRKYFVETNRPRGNPRVEKNKKKSRVDKIFFPLHHDTDQYFRNRDVISPDRFITVTQKVHGTSIRVAHTLVTRELSWLERLAKRFGVAVKETEYAMIYGSRRVTKDVNNKDQRHFYAADEDGLDLWSREGKKLDGILPEGYILYGELLGWTPGGEPIQQGYTYKIPRGTAELYVYRVAQINPRGIQVDLTWDQVVEFCRDHGLKAVPELWRGSHADFVAEDWLDKRYRDEGYQQALPLDQGKGIVDEGVVVRVDGLTPYCLKSKSPLFFRHESKLLDADVIDLESAESQ